MALLTRIDELLLLAVAAIGPEAYGVGIRKYLQNVTGKAYSTSAIYVPLRKLVERGFLECTEGAPTSERGGRSKRYYRLTAAGISALEDMRRVQETMWARVPDFSRLRNALA